MSSSDRRLENEESRDIVLPPVGHRRIPFGAMVSRVTIVVPL